MIPCARLCGFLPHFLLRPRRFGNATGNDRLMVMMVSTFRLHVILMFRRIVGVIATPLFPVMLMTAVSRTREESLRIVTHHILLELLKLL